MGMIVHPVVGSGEVVRLDKVLAQNAPYSAEDPAVQVVSSDGEMAVIPDEVFSALREIVGALARGKSVTLLADDAELTTQEAAEVLQVSRPHVIKLIDAGELHCRRVGTHRRVKAEDVLALRRRQDAQRLEFLKELIGTSEPEHR